MVSLRRQSGEFGDAKVTRVQGTEYQRRELHRAGGGEKERAFSGDLQKVPLKFSAEHLISMYI